MRLWRRPSRFLVAAPMHVVTSGVRVGCVAVAPCDGGETEARRGWHEAWGLLADLGLQNLLGLRPEARDRAERVLGVLVCRVTDLLDYVLGDFAGRDVWRVWSWTRTQQLALAIVGLLVAAGAGLLHCCDRPAFLWARSDAVWSGA